MSPRFELQQQASFADSHHSFYKRMALLVLLKWDGILDDFFCWLDEEEDQRIELRKRKVMFL
jgi:hypothetical protein